VKKCILLSIICCFFTAISFTLNAQDVIDVPLQGQKPPGNLGKPNSETGFTLSCYVMVSTNTLFITCSSGTINAIVQLDNETTGFSSMAPVQLSAIPSSFPLLGSGSYCIEIMLSSGETYYGYFYL